MSDIDNDVLEPDLDNDEEQLPSPPDEEDKRQVNYGILVYVDDTGEYGMQIIGKERSSTNDLLALVDMAQRKLEIIWSAQHDPASQAMLRDIAELKKGQIGSQKALQAIMTILKGLTKGMVDLSNKK